MKGHKIYWFYDGLLFYEVGYNYSISGEKVTLKLLWKFKKGSKEKAIKLVKHFESVGK